MESSREQSGAEMNTTYLPKHFSVSDAAALRIAEQFPFASLISIDESGAPFVNHLPLLVERSQDGSLKLVGHMAKRNPQWSHFKRDANALAVFQGPHAYITPKWYVSGRDVPTWNYAVVHVAGKVNLIEDFEGLTGILRKITMRFEQGRPEPWEFKLPDDLLDAPTLTNAIIGFEIEAKKIDSKFKLSQNRPEEDKQGVIQGLEGQTDEMSRLVRQMMVEAAQGEEQ